MTQLMDPAVARQFDRLPPAAIEAEMCLLASMMLDKDMIGQVVTLVDREAFYQADHQIIFDVLLKLYEQRRARIEAGQPSACRSQAGSSERHSADGNRGQTGAE